MDQNVSHIVSECNELAQKSARNSDMIKLKHCCAGSGGRLMEKVIHEKYYEHFLEKEMGILENDTVKILWDFSKQTDKN